MVILQEYVLPFKNSLLRTSARRRPFFEYFAPWDFSSLVPEAEMLQEPKKLQLIMGYVAHVKLR